MRHLKPPSNMRKRVGVLFPFTGSGTANAPVQRVLIAAALGSILAPGTGLKMLLRTPK